MAIESPAHVKLDFFIAGLVGQFKNQGINE